MSVTNLVLASGSLLCMILHHADVTSFLDPFIGPNQSSLQLYSVPVQNITVARVQKLFSGRKKAPSTPDTLSASGRTVAQPNLDDNADTKLSFTMKKYVGPFRQGDLLLHLGTPPSTC